jgi:short-subunit dehydrogenase
MLKVNMYPITLLSKYGILKFKNEEGPCVLVSVSSYSSVRPYARAGIYGGCKRFNSVWGNLIERENVDSIVLYPGLVTTNMVGYLNNSFNCCMPAETANGTLCSLGRTARTNGSLIHSIWNVQIMWTPEYIRNIQRRAEGGAVPEGSYKLWFHI